MAVRPPGKDELAAIARGYGPREVHIARALGMIPNTAPFDISGHPAFERLTGGFPAPPAPPAAA